eukprot:GHVU01061780.1.p1 GENE.GHVU01061780.1~~GHVU01061780.1.p1  ORF type:complete len:111 (+),score=23.74 GHVU01061780.1:77-409(+)
MMMMRERDRLSMMMIDTQTDGQTAVIRLSGAVSKEGRSRGGGVREEERKREREKERDKERKRGREGGRTWLGEREDMVGLQGRQRTQRPHPGYVCASGGDRSLTGRQVRD